MGTLPALTGGSPILLNEILVEGLFPQIRKKPQINRVVLDLCCCAGKKRVPHKKF